MALEAMSELTQDHVVAGRFEQAQAHDVMRPPERVRHNLPAQTTPFIGRKRELAALDAFIAEPGLTLVTVVKLGGIGKTRTAIEAARAIAADGAEMFPDDVAFVTFAPVDDRESALRALADALDYEFAGVEEAQDRQLLTVLSLEKVLGSGVGRLLDDILRAAPGVKLLVTSRERLNLRAEMVLMLSGLDADLPALIEGEPSMSARPLMPDGSL